MSVRANVSPVALRTRDVADGDLTAHDRIVLVLRRRGPDGKTHELGIA